MDGATMWVATVIFIILLCLFYVARSLWNDKRNGDIVNNYKTAMRAYANEESVRHSELARKRMEAGPAVSSVLKELIMDLGATRAILCEMHNGTNNLNGIPFLYADAMYEETVRTADYVTDEYRNFNIARYPFIGNHFYDQIWIGTRDDIDAEDPHLAAKLKYTGAEFGALQVIQGLRAPIGLLGITYDAAAAKNKPSKTLITQKMDMAAQKICMLLSSIEDERELNMKNGITHQYGGRQYKNV